VKAIVKRTPRGNYQTLNKMSDQQQHFKLGERGYHVFANEYQGDPKIHIRKFTKNPLKGNHLLQNME